MFTCLHLADILSMGLRFHTSSGVTYAYAPSHWTTRVKDCFRRHSPGSKAVPPKLLRSSFIVALRDAKSGCPDVLKEKQSCPPLIIAFAVPSPRLSHCNLTCHVMHGRVLRMR